MTKEREREKWWLWLDGKRGSAMNMALDETLLLWAVRIGKPLLRFYDWEKPAITIGYTQDYDSAVQDGMDVVRRPTGGGVVYHGEDLTYTFAMPPDHSICSLDRMESYHFFHRPLLEALAVFGVEGQLSESSREVIDRATMKCFVTPTRYDVLTGDAKFAGSAQRRTRDGLLHQGSVALKEVDVSREGLIAEYPKALAKSVDIEFSEFTPGDDFLSFASDLADRKYGTEAWNRFREQP